MITIADIENAVIERLKEKGLEAGEIKVQKGTDGLVKPAVFVATEEGRYEKVTEKTYRQTVSLFVYIVVKNLKNAAARRHAVYPLLEGTVGILLAQTLGLDITPLKPLSFRNITTQELEELGLIGYQVGFETAYYIEKMSEEFATELLRIGLEYYLKPGDDIEDAVDTVTLD